MKDKMTKIIKTAVILAVTLLVAVGIYNRYYKIDLSLYDYSYEAQTVESPDDEQKIRLNVYKTEENSSETYIMATLVGKTYYNENHEITEKETSRVIFWNKVDQEQVNNDTITADWIDENTVKIGDETLNVNCDYYDYRCYTVPIF